MPMRRIVQPARLVADVVERQWRLRRSIGVTPQPRRRLEAIPRRQPPPVTGDQRNGANDVVEHCLTDEIVEVHADPAGLDALAPAGDLALERVGRLDVDAEQSMTVRTGARAAAA